MPKKDKQILEKIEESIFITMLALGIAIMFIGFSFFPTELSYFRKMALALGVSFPGLYIATKSLLLWCKAKGRWVNWLETIVLVLTIIMVVFAIVAFALSFFIDEPQDYAAFFTSYPLHQTSTLPSYADI